MAGEDDGPSVPVCRWPCPGQEPLGLAPSPGQEPHVHPPDAAQPAGLGHTCVSRESDGQSVSHAAGQLCGLDRHTDRAGP